VPVQLRLSGDFDFPASGMLLCAHQTCVIMVEAVTVGGITSLRCRKPNRHAP